MTVKTKKKAAIITSFNTKVRSQRPPFALMEHKTTNDKQEKIAQSGCFGECSLRGAVDPTSTMSQEDEEPQPAFTAVIPQVVSLPLIIRDIFCLCFSR